jgi:hypothetical protein
LDEIKTRKPSRDHAMITKEEKKDLPLSQVSLTHGSSLGFPLTNVDPNLTCQLRGRLVPYIRLNQAGGMQAGRVRLLGPGIGPGSEHAASSPQPGYGETAESAVFSSQAARVQLFSCLMMYQHLVSKY